MNDLIFRYWGKARHTENSEFAYHPLPYHCLDVAAVASVWLDNSPVLRNRLLIETNSKVTKAWLLFFIALHDLGKFDVRFQRKAESVTCSLWKGFENAESVSTFDHGRAGVGWWAKESAGLGFLEKDTTLEWIRMVAGHHGSLNLSVPANDSLYQIDADDEVIQHDYKARKNWIKELIDLFLVPAEADLNDIHEPSQLLPGFCSVCDWLGSNEEWFKYDTNRVSLNEYFNKSQKDVKIALLKSGVLGQHAQSGGMSIIFPDKKPRSVQSYIQQLPLEPSLLLIEAPTGSGKTEAALAHASRLIANDLAESLIFALPTQATANAMLSRLEKVAPQIFPESPNVVLAHGKARYNLKFGDLKQAGKTVQNKEEAQAQCAEWIGNSRKRVFLGQIGVCTVDQVMLSVLPVRHHFVRAFGVKRGVLIIDEVHAYDSYMITLLGEVLKAQQASGGSAVLLSATLSRTQRERLVSYWSNGTIPGKDNTYPLLTFANDNSVYEFQIDEIPAKKNVQCSLKKREYLLPNNLDLQEILNAANKGAKVVVICNLVADAQKVYAELISQSNQIQVDLFHARFTFSDRQSKEIGVLENYGENRVSGGRILVATQVVEQSLDLDFDWMLTQLCPADLLFQRIGRLHRHERKRPEGFEIPKITVFAPEGINFEGHGFIYANHRALWRTQQLLEQTTTINFPEAYRDWIESVYAENPWENEPDEIVNAFELFTESEFGRRFSALQFAVSEMNPFADTDGNAAALTRDGEMNLNVLLIQNRNTLLDGMVWNKLKKFYQDEALDHNTVSVPVSWKRHLPQADRYGRIRLKMSLQRDNDQETWYSETDTADFSYTKTRGFEMEKKSRT